MKKIISLDILRILSGFFVVFMHTTDQFLLFPQYVGGGSWYIVYYFNTLGKIAVPIFVMMSGYLLFNSKKIENRTNFFKKRFKRVGVPLFLWILVFFLWRLLWDKISITPSYIYKTLVTVDIGPLYFLVVIMQLYLLTPYLFNIFTRNGKFYSFRLFSLWIICMLIVAVPYFFGNKFSYSQSIFTIALPYTFYYVLGGYLKNLELSLRHALFFIPIFIFVPLLIILIARGNLSSYMTNYFSPTVIVLSVSSFIFFVTFEKYFNKNLNKLQKKILGYFSGSILGIYLIHPYVLEIIRRYTNMTPGHIYSPLWLGIFGIAFIVFVVCFLIVLVGKKIPIIRIMLE